MHKARNADAVFVISGGGRRASLPVAAIEDVATAVPAVPLPLIAELSPTGVLEGAAPCGKALTAQIDLAHAWGGGRGEGRYTLRLCTSRGPIVVRVERVVGPVAPAADLPCAMAEIETLLTGWLGQAPAKPPPPAKLPPGLAVLVLEAGGRRIALPAGAVEAVARPGAAWVPRGGGVAQRVVSLASGLLPGLALADWLGVPSVGPDVWAVIVRVGDHRLAITAERVHMPPPVPAAAVQVVRLSHNDAVWLADVAGAPLELLSPAAFAKPGDLLAMAPDISAAPSLSAPPRPRLAISAQDGGVMLRAGPFGCVLPQQVVGGIHTGLSLAKARAPGALPVFELGSLLGLARPPVLSPVLVVLHRSGRRAVALLAETVALAAPAADWAALPPAPAALHALFDAARLSAGTCQVRLRPTALASRAGLLATKVAAAFHGWVVVAGAAPVTGQAGAGPAGEDKCSVI